MKHIIGLAEHELRMSNAERLIAYEPLTLINGHCLICGMSGTGKSYQSTRMLNSAARAGLSVDVFDVHDELHEIEGCKAVTYSQATRYGYNPLILNTDPHIGGVERQAQNIVDLMEEAASLGIKQTAALRNLIIDTYAAQGTFRDNTSTWWKQQIDEATRNRLISTRQFAELRKYYPTLDDLRSYATTKIRELKIGSSSETMRTFEELQQLMKKLNSLNSKYAKTRNDEEIAKIESQIALTKSDLISKYAAHIEAMQTGREIEDIMKYDSPDVLTALVARLDEINSAGIFRANAPPFGDAKVRVHQIKSLTNDQQILFVKLRLKAIFDEVKSKGPIKRGEGLRHIIFLDEAHKFMRSNNDDIINVIAKEARKFGLALWSASQQPTDFPESLTTNVGATFILGISSFYWQKAAKAFRITQEQLETIRPMEIIAAKFQRQGQPDPAFVNIIVPNNASANGVRAANRLARAA